MGKPLAIVVALLLLLTFLLTESRIRDQGPRARMQQSLQALQLHNAELNRDVLMARAGLLANYDSLARTGHNVSRDMAALEAESTRLADPPGGEIGKTLAALSDAIKVKLTRIEYLKSDNALLRNSLCYFTQVVGSLRARGDTGRPAMTISSLSQAMLEFVQSPDADRRREAEAVLAQMSGNTPSRHSVEPLNVHGRLVIDMLPRVDGLMNEIIQSPVSDQAEKLHDAVLKYGGMVDARSQKFRILLYVVALVLLGYLVYQYRRLRAKAFELRCKEIQLIQANKMTALGTLVSSVAHEVNNPNQIVLMNGGVLAGAWEDVVVILDGYRREAGKFSIGGLPYEEMRTTIGDLIREMQDGARRIEGILTDLKDFVRPGVRASEVFQLNDTVRRALRLLTHLIKKRTDLFHVRLGKGLPPVHGNPQQMEQVVVNLVMNALEALPDRRRTVAVSTTFEAEGGGQVSLEVQDEGVGIPREYIPRLGEPFFTTKEASGGTGLGLAITSSLVRSHKGQLTFTSEPGKGTEARVTVPCALDERASEGKF